MGIIEPTADQIRKLRGQPDEGPVVMLNLLKFRPAGGAESYARYSRTAERLVKKLGGKVIYQGKFEMTFIGQEDWDAVLLVEYPSRAAFLQMTRSTEYQDVVRFRSEALTDSRLYATIPGEKNFATEDSENKR
jgi:uncharacterized protein (DUF1330 family)